MRLTQKEANAICDFIGPMTDYDIKAILCRIYEDEYKINEVISTISEIFMKASDASKKAAPSD